MNYYFIIAQIFGVLYFLFFVADTITDKKEKVLLYNILSNIASAVQYALLGAFSAALSLFITLPRNLIFNKYKNKKIPVIFLLLFIVLSAAVSFMTYDGLISLIPIINIVIFTYSIWQNDVKIIKIAIIITSALEIIYGLYYKAYITCVASVIYIILSTYSYIRLCRIEKRKKKRKKHLK